MITIIMIIHIVEMFKLMLQNVPCTQYTITSVREALKELMLIADNGNYSKIFDMLSEYKIPLYTSRIPRI